MNLNDIYEQRNRLYLQMNNVTRGGIVTGICIGVVCFILGMVFKEETRTWGSFLFNLMLFFSLSLGGIAFGNMQDVIGATWGRPIKRLHESFGSFLIWATGFFFIFFICIKFGILGADRVYSWIHDPHIVSHFPGKNVWLTPDRMLIRDVLSLLCILGLSTWHFKLTLGPDLALVQGNKAEAHRLGLTSKEKLRYWSAPVMILYALCFSCICFDLTMSLAPTWFSTLWGGWSFAIMMHILTASTLIFMFALKDTPIGAFFQRQQFHDVGKLMHGFTVFFAYLTYAHVLTYWYTNIPEETSYFITRLKAPWIYFLLVSPVLSFIIPFFALIPKISKWSGNLTLPICAVVLLSQWITYLVIVMPEVADAAAWRFPWLEMGLFCGFLSLFLAVVFRFGSKVPMISIADPLLLAALHDCHK